MGHGEADDTANPFHPRNQRLFFHNFGKIVYELFDRNQLTGDTLPHQLAVFVD
jgi:hypothetical protein